MKALVLAVAGAVVLWTAACGETAAAPATVPATSKVAPATSKTVTEKAGPLVTMPDAVGMVLQDAQDLMQKVTGDPVYLTRSHDVRFTRLQVLDRGWKVCSQTVRKGAKFDPATTVPDFGVVKLAESCP